MSSYVVSTLSASMYYAELRLLEWLNAYRYEAACLVPAVSISSAVSIILTCICMPRSNVAPKLKLFYMLGAIFSAPVLVVGEILNYFTGAAVRVYSSGASFFYLELASSAACKLCWFMTLVNDSAGTFVAVQLALERLMVITFPFRAYMFTAKRSAIGCCVMLLILAGFNCSSLYIYDLHSSDAGISCINSADTELLESIIPVIDYVVPISVLVLVTVALTVALKHHTSSAAALRTPGQAIPNADTTRATLTVLMVSAARCIIYLPPIGTNLSYKLVDMDQVALSQAVFLYNYFLMLSPLISVMDFCVYCVLIPSFRKTTRNVLQCRCVRAEN
jgi:hypothetical protein